MTGDAEPCSVCAGEDARPLAVVLELCGHVLCAEHFRALWNVATHSIDRCPECRSTEPQCGALSVHAMARATDESKAFIEWFRARHAVDRSLTLALMVLGARLDDVIGRLERRRAVPPPRRTPPPWIECAFVVALSVAAVNAWQFCG